MLFVRYYSNSLAGKRYLPVAGAKKKKREKKHLNYVSINQIGLGVVVGLTDNKKEVTTELKIAIK